MSLQELGRSLPDQIAALREQHLSSLPPPAEFLDVHRVSRPKDSAELSARVSSNLTRYRGYYLLIAAALAVFSVLTSPSRV